LQFCRSRKIKKRHFVILSSGWVLRRVKQRKEEERKQGRKEGEGGRKGKDKKEKKRKEESIHVRACRARAPKQTSFIPKNKLGPWLYFLISEMRYGLSNYLTHNPKTIFWGDIAAQRFR
jgi:hypothetical protein